MGIYLNPGDDMLKISRRSEIYVDKSGMLEVLNQLFLSEKRYICVSRPRRFGKSMAANMVSAYYDRTVDGKKAFEGLKIASAQSFEEYRNKYDVVKLNMQDFLSRSKGDMDVLIQNVHKKIFKDFRRAYPEIDFDEDDFSDAFEDIYAETGRHFVIIIDEWDCIFRVKKDDEEAQRKYLDFLRDWLKDKAYIALAYMTGILPIKKYGIHSALNMFSEYSMMDAGKLAEYVGFTEEEVKALCEEFDMSFENTKNWYDGYFLEEVGSLYNPRSVVESMTEHKFNNYWNRTETFEALKIYIDMNFDGLRDTVIELMAGRRKRIDTSSFSNDMTTFASKDDVLTLLIHLGYLGFDFENSEVFIPNKEILSEYVTATKYEERWSALTKALKNSRELLKATVAEDVEAVAEMIEEAHLETSHIQYNDENALSYTISLAYYYAREFYTVIRELPTGKGFADIAYIPLRHFADKYPAMIVELKWNKDADTAIKQIKEKRYTKLFENYQGKVLLVGISYDKETRKHTCVIENWEKDD